MAFCGLSGQRPHHPALLEIVAHLRQNPRLRRPHTIGGDRF